MPCNHPFYPFMLEAVHLGAKARFQTAPNPCVGALLVRDGRVAASGYHHGPGQNHAEVEALEDARSKGVDPSECVMVVTLEPCTHTGKTPPCCEAILAAGIKHVVIGALDPTERAGGGAELLRAAGVRVETGVAGRECLDLIDDFLVWTKTEYPYVVIKLATTMDGRIATRTGHSRWITSLASRRLVHGIRQHMDALVVGGNTFYQDNPWLTYRPVDDEAAQQGEVPGGKQPLAVVVTSRLPDASSQYYLLQKRPESTIFWTTVAAGASPKAEALRKLGVRVYGLPSQPRANPRGSGMRAELELDQGLAILRKEHNCHYVLCEGGGRLGLTLLDKGLANELALHMAPKILGDNDATPLFDGRAPIHMDEALQLKFMSAVMADTDLIVVMRPDRLGQSMKKD